MSRLTPLHSLHLSHGATLVPYASHLLPLTFAKTSIVQQIKHTRSKATIFDVSHMTQITFNKKEIPSCITASKVIDGCAKLTVLTNDKGGIVDDAIVSVTGKV
jgi:aminomethyltransferase